MPMNGRLMREQIQDALTVVLVLIASAALGGLIGWLTGASSTPVAAAVIPLAFGFTGVLWQRYSEIKDRLRATVAAAERGNREEMWLASGRSDNGLGGSAGGAASVVSRPAPEPLHTVAREAS